MIRSVLILLLASIHLVNSLSSFQPTTDNNNNKKNDLNRKDFLAVITSTAAVGVGFALPQVSNASEGGWGVSPERPVVVLGAGGRTGMEVVQQLAREGIHTISMTRTGVDPFRVIKLPTELRTYITHYPETVDVTSLESLDHALEATKASAIIFCASASKQGGNAFDVDDKGVGNTATLAKKFGTRLVVISALAVDRPESKSYQITNTLGGNFNGIMDAKLNGEGKVRSQLKDYVILRPGPLMNGKSTTGGASGIEINQGDTVGGGLSRDELAAAAVGALQSGVKGATVEVYRKSTATKLQPEFRIPSGREHYGESYKAMFNSVDVD